MRYIILIYICSLLSCTPSTKKYDDLIKEYKEFKPSIFNRKSIRLFKKFRKISIKEKFSKKQLAEIYHSLGWLAGTIGLNYYNNRGKLRAELNKVPSGLVKATYWTGYSCYYYRRSMNLRSYSSDARKNITKGNQDERCDKTVPHYLNTHQIKLLRGTCKNYSRQKIIPKDGCYYINLVTK